MTLEETLSCGILTEADWLPGQAAPALELRRDCPGKGEWLIVQRWPSEIPLTWIIAGPVAERRAWRRYYLCQADIAKARADESITEKEEAQMTGDGYYKALGDYYGQKCGPSCPVEAGEQAQRHGPAPDLDPIRHRAFADIEEWRKALAEYAQAAQLNMAKNWRDITIDLWNNDRHCTCQVGAVACPCPAGVALAKAGGKCHCGLFIGHNVD